MWLVALTVAISLVAGPSHATAVPTARHADSAVCVCIPTTGAMSAAFNLASADRLGPGYPHLPRIGVDSAFVPAVILEAVAWVESGWRQFAGTVPLVSPDYGYGTMQITDGMAGAAGPTGTRPVATQTRIIGDYAYNIGFGARMLAQYFVAEPAINERDPTAVEDWYYALWAYNGWYSNNPNGSWARIGTPAQNPNTFPYQERVYWWVQHPPTDSEGHPLWAPVKVTLPSNAQVGLHPHALTISPVHTVIPQVYGATYDAPMGLTAMHEGSTTSAHVAVFNSGGLPWALSGGASFGLMYHWVLPGHQSSPLYDPHLGGIDEADSKSPVMFPAAVPVGGSVRVPVTITAPSMTGRFLLAWDVVGKSPGWFSYNGAPPGIQSVHVVRPNVPVSPYQDPPVPPALQGDHAWTVTLTSVPVSSSELVGAAYSETMLTFNPGGTSWTAGYHLQLVGGSSQISLPMPVVNPCRAIPVTIAGITGARVASTTAAERSPAIPAAKRAMASAVAGATTTMSAREASSM